MADSHVRLRAEILGNGLMPNHFHWVILFPLGTYRSSRYGGSTGGLLP
jgi:hypothetical protein